MRYREVAQQGYQREADAIREAYARGERDNAASLVTNEMLELLTLSGNEKRARQRLAQYRAAGVNLPILHFVDGLSIHSIRATMEALAPSRN